MLTRRRTESSSSEPPSQCEISMLFPSIPAELFCTKPGLPRLKHLLEAGTLSPEFGTTRRNAFLLSLDWITMTEFAQSIVIQ